MMHWSEGRVRIALALAALLTAAAPLAGAAEPLRILVYQYTYEEHTFGASADMSQGHVNESNSSASDARAGQITVQIVSPAEDGGWVLDITQAIERQARPLQTARCSVYGHTTDIVCEGGLRPTPEELTLLTYLGRFFYESGRIDAAGHWHTSPLVHGQMKIDNDFTVTKTEASVRTLKVSREGSSPAWGAGPPRTRYRWCGRRPSSGRGTAEPAARWPG